MLACLLQLAQRYEENEPLFVSVIHSNIETSQKFIPHLTIQYGNLNDPGFGQLADEIARGFGTNFSKNSQHGVEFWMQSKKLSLDKIQIF
jgi:hypothetical protein